DVPEDSAPGLHQPGRRDALHPGPAPPGPQPLPGPVGQRCRSVVGQRQKESAEGHRGDHVWQGLHGRAGEAAAALLPPDAEDGADAPGPRLHHEAEPRQHGAPVRADDHGLQVSGLPVSAAQRPAAAVLQPPGRHQGAGPGHAPPGWTSWTTPTGGWPRWVQRPVGAV
ncbi:unnamed protein product, partial [Tetraodon nigroviridis]